MYIIYMNTNIVPSCTLHLLHNVTKVSANLIIQSSHHSHDIYHILVVCNGSQPKGVEIPTPHIHYVTTITTKLIYCQSTHTSGICTGFRQCSGTYKTALRPSPHLPYFPMSSTYHQQTAADHSANMEHATQHTPNSSDPNPTTPFPGKHTFASYVGVSTWKGTYCVFLDIRRHLCQPNNCMYLIIKIHHWTCEPLDINPGMVIVIKIRALPSRDL